jgi:hypothetical protein
VNVVLDHLTARSRRCVIRRPTVGVDIHDPSAPLIRAQAPTLASHEKSLPTSALALDSSLAGAGSWGLRATSSPDVLE